MAVSHLLWCPLGSVAAVDVVVGGAVVAVVIAVVVAAVVVVAVTLVAVVHWVTCHKTACKCELLQLLVYDGAANKQRTINETNEKLSHDKFCFGMMPKSSWE